MLISSFHSCSYQQASFGAFSKSAQLASTLQGIEIVLDEYIRSELAGRFGNSTHSVPTISATTMATQIQMIVCISIAMIFSAEVSAQGPVAAPVTAPFVAPTIAPTTASPPPLVAAPSVAPSSVPSVTPSTTPVAAPKLAPIATPTSAPAPAPANEKSAGVMISTTGWRTLVLASGVLVAAAF